MEEIDIWRSAHLLIKLHGDDAELVAAQLFEAGDLLDCNALIEIAHAIEATVRRKPRAGEALH